MKSVGVIAISLFGLVAGCQSTPASLGASAYAGEIRFLYFDGCPASPNMRRNLIDALGQLGVVSHIDEVDLEALPTGDPLLRYGAPTVLVDGRDLLGAPPSSSAALMCRVYADGVPDAGQIADRLRQATGER